jgi:hypothetical protein
MSQEEMKFKVNTKIKVEKYPEGVSQQDIDNGKYTPEVVEIDDTVEMTKKELEQLGYKSE